MDKTESHIGNRIPENGQTMDYRQRVTEVGDKGSDGPPSGPDASLGLRGRGMLFELAIRSDVCRRALTVALIVGPVIGLINHSAKIVGGTMESGDWLRFGLTFIVPYSVSTWSSVMALRGRGADGV